MKLVIHYAAGELFCTACEDYVYLSDIDSEVTVRHA